MKGNYERLFEELHKREPSPELRGKILARIAYERLLTRVRIGSFGMLALAAALSMFPAWHELSLEVSRSGFSQFVSLFFSDWNATAAFWQDLAFSLAESFPVAGAAAVLVSALVFLYSLRHLVRDMSPLFRRSNLVRA